MTNPKRDPVTAKPRLPLWEFRPRVVLLGLFLAGLVLWKLPQWQVVGLSRDFASRHPHGRVLEATTEELRLIDERRRTLTQIFGSFGLLAGLYFAHRRISATEENVKIAQEGQRTAEEGQITERFTKAIEQLGRNKLEVRLGSVYALERIARDSRKDHWTVMEVLAAFIRENARRKGPTVEKKVGSSNNPPADIQAAVTAIGRRNAVWDKERIDLTGVDLSNADLTRANLRTANLTHADLCDARLCMADLTHADLIKSNLIRANCTNAFLTGATLSDAHLMQANLNVAKLDKAILNGTILRNANLLSANLNGAVLTGADLRGADLRKANLIGALGLTLQQVESATTDEDTKLPDNLKMDGKQDEPEDEGSE